MLPGYASHSGWPTRRRSRGMAPSGKAGLVTRLPPYAPQRAVAGAFYQVRAVNSIPLWSRPGAVAQCPAGAGLSAARLARSAAAVMLRSIPPNTAPWNGDMDLQYACPASPRGWKMARWL